MTKLLMFPFDRVKRRHSSSGSSEAEIIIFSGVHVERREFDKDMPVAKPKPRRRSRQQAVKLQED
jgi:hypothetical protein